MKERPILFSGAMVRALLDGSKTQTRRIVKARRGWPIHFIGGCGDVDDPSCYGFEDLNTGLWWTLMPDSREDNNQIPSPYGMAGDRLYVRETFWAYGRWETRFSEKKQRDEWHFFDMTIECDRLYQFSDPTPDRQRDRSGVAPAWWKRPAIHMPRVASRITLEILYARVERLDHITEADAKREGCAPAWLDIDGVTVHAHEKPTYRQGFARLWRDINGDASWDANPWVWVIEFKRVAP